MDLDVRRLLDSAVTVFQKLDAKTAGAKADAYYPVVLDPASWAQDFTRTVDSDGVVHLARAVKIQVPATTAEYLPYREWAVKALEGTSEGFYSLKGGDVAAFGKVAVQGPLSRSEMLAETEGLQRCEVSAVRDCRNNGAATTIDGGAGKYLSMVYAEGK